MNKDIPIGYSEISHILCEIDVLWVSGSGEIDSLFEVEHSTTIYSGLLRFNDVLLTNPKLKHFSIVANEHRRDVFARQAFRPTFVRSGLAELDELPGILKCLQLVSSTRGSKIPGEPTSERTIIRA